MRRFEDLHIGDKFVTLIDIQAIQEGELSELPVYTKCSSYTADRPLYKERFDPHIQVLPVCV